MVPESCRLCTTTYLPPRLTACLPPPSPLQRDKFQRDFGIIQQTQTNIEVELEKLSRHRDAEGGRMAKLGAEVAALLGELRGVAGPEEEVPADEALRGQDVEDHVFKVGAHLEGWVGGCGRVREHPDGWVGEIWSCGTGCVCVCLCALSAEGCVCALRGTTRMWGGLGCKVLHMPLTSPLVASNIAATC